jgi:hypothetical protein
VLRVVTITRANLPVLTSVWWLPVLALTTDVVDGRMARANGTASRFGAAGAGWWTFLARGYYDLPRLCRRR